MTTEFQSLAATSIQPSISQGPPASQPPLHLWFPSSTTLPHTIIIIAVASGVLILIVCWSPRSHHHDSHQRLNLRTFIWHTTRTNLLFSSQTTPKASIIVRRPLIRHSEAIKGADIWTRQHTRGERYVIMKQQLTLTCATPARSSAIVQTVLLEKRISLGICVQMERRSFFFYYYA